MRIYTFIFFVSIPFSAIAQLSIPSMTSESTETLYLMDNGSMISLPDLGSKGIDRRNSAQAICTEVNDYFYYSGLWNGGDPDKIEEEGININLNIGDKFFFTETYNKAYTRSGTLPKSRSCEDIEPEKVLTDTYTKVFISKLYFEDGSDYLEYDLCSNDESRILIIDTTIVVTEDGYFNDDGIITSDAYLATPKIEVESLNGISSIIAFPTDDEKYQSYFFDVSQAQDGDNLIKCTFHFHNGIRELTINFKKGDPEISQSISVQDVCLNNKVEITDFTYDGDEVVIGSDTPELDDLIEKEGEQYFINTTNSNIPAGEYEITLTAKKGICEADIVRKIVIHPQPIVFAGSDLDICSNIGVIDLSIYGDEIPTINGNELGGVSTGRFYWSWDGVQLTEGESVFDPADLDAGIYEFTLTYFDENACVQTAFKSVTIQDSSPVSAGDDIASCSNIDNLNLFDFAGFSPENGEWSSDEIDIEGSIINLTSLTFEETELVKEFSITYSVSNQNSCISSESKLLTIYESPEKPVLTQSLICETGQSVLIIENYNSKYNYQWYKEGVEVQGEKGNELITTLINNEIVYSVKAINPLLEDCSSNTELTVKPIETPPAPNAEDVVVCNTEPVTLQATHPAEVDYFKWYDYLDNELTTSGLGDVYTTQTAITQDIYFYVSAVINGCESDKARVDVYKLNKPEAPEIENTEVCGKGNISLFANSTADIIFWFDSETSEDPIYQGNEYTITLESSTRFYVSSVKIRELDNGKFYCESERIPIDAIIHEAPDKPNDFEYTTCGNEFVELTATGGVGEYYWYNQSNIKVGEGSSFLVGQVDRDQIFYVSTISASGCESELATMEIDFQTKPPQPIINDISRCGQGKVNIIPTLPITSEEATYRFYSDLDRDNFIYEGESYSPEIIENTTIYVSAVINGCEGIQRAVSISLTDLPSPPTANDKNYCGTSSVSFTATHNSFGGTINWYSNEDDEEPLYTGNNFSIDSLSITTSYYVATVSAEGCESYPRTKVTAYIHEIPAPPDIEDAFICSNSGEVDLFVKSPSPNLRYEWYQNGEIISQGTIFNTGLITSTSVYHVKAISNQDCSSLLKEVKAVLVNNEPLDIGKDISICKYGEVYNLASDIDTSLKGGIFSGEGISDSLFVPANLDAGTYSIKYSVNVGSCQAFGQRNITITDGIGSEVLSLGALESTCENSFAIDLSDYTDYKMGTWTGLGVVNNYFEPSLVSAGLYTLTYEVNINGCDYQAEKVIEVRKSFATEPSIIAAKNDFCEGEEVILLVGQNENTNNTDYTWYNATTNEQLAKGTAYSFIASQSIEINCVGVDNDGCASIPALTTINVFDFPDSIQVSKDSISDYEYIEFNVFDTITSNTYQWEFGNGQTSSEQNPAVFFYDEGVYTVNLLISNMENGCSANLSTSIVVGSTDTTGIITSLEEEFDFYQINIFPNPFKLDFAIELNTNRPIQDVHISFFNSIGKVLYETTIATQVGSNQINIPPTTLYTLPTGMYLIKISTPTFFSQNLKVLKR
ncbi:MAG: hypothetical protein CMO01_27235 [Thalassobius sp.]|nr:hypothetical protein [Thalassovita sp.]